MVPSAVDAYLDHVAGELVMGLGEFLQPLGRIDDTSRVPLERLSVDVSDESQALVRAHGADVVGVLSYVLGCTHQLWVRIAYIDHRKQSASQSRQDRTPGERVVDRGQ